MKIIFDWLRVGLVRSIDQLLDQDLTPKEYRPKQSILIIDDEEFVWKEDISKLGYPVQHEKDVQRGFDFSKFSIILCDIDGVGKHFGKNANGISIMKAIKKDYPLKPIIVYSGTIDLSIAKAYTDRTLEKDSDFETWTEILDNFSVEICSPKKQWKIARNRLINLNLPLVKIMELEDKFVKYVEKNDGHSSINNFELYLNKEKGLSNAAKTILLNVVSNLASAGILAVI